MLQKINNQLGQKLIRWNSINLWSPAVIIISVFIFILLQPNPYNDQSHSQKLTDSKSANHQVAIVPKTPKATATPQKAAAVPQSSPTPALAKAATPTTGATKPEPVVTPSPASNVSGLTPTAPSPTPSSPQSPSSQTTTGYTSYNWSGYLATNSSFTSVSGAWTATDATTNGSSISADSTWIGIGGVSSSDLIQVGTQNIISAGGQVSTSAFYELLPNVSQPVPGVTVSPGDSIAASVSEISSGQWAISITDKTDSESDTIDVSYASSLSSAEWIEEDPSFSFRQLIPFDNFKEASFTDASVVENGRTVNIASSTAQPVTMENVGGQTIAVPSAIGGDGASFSVTP